MQKIPEIRILYRYYRQTLEKKPEITGTMPGIWQPWVRAKSSPQCSIILPRYKAVLEYVQPQKVSASGLTKKCVKIRLLTVHFQSSWTICKLDIISLFSEIKLSHDIQPVFSIKLYWVSNNMDRRSGPMKHGA